MRFCRTPFAFVALAALVSCAQGLRPVGADLSGDYAFHKRGMTGTMAIFENAPQPVRVVIETSKILPNHDTCSLVAFPVRGVDGALTGPAMEPDGSSLPAPNCSIRIDRIGSNQVRVSEKQCWIALCGVHATFDGDYRRARR
jgi:hypothetical protein